MQFCGARSFVSVLLFVLATPAGSTTASSQDPKQVVETVAFAEAFARRLPGRRWGAISQPVTDAARTNVLQTLPTEGHVTPSAAEQQKVALTRALLRAVDRPDIVIVVIDVPQAFIGLHGRVVLLISRPALALLSAPELRALSAHELGHDVLWDEYEDARRNKADARMQTLELRCDALAVLILESEALPAAPLVSGLFKLERFNRRIHAVADASRYPPLELRQKVATAVAVRLRPLSARLERRP